MTARPLHNYDMKRPPNTSYSMWRISLNISYVTGGGREREKVTYGMIYHICVDIYMYMISFLGEAIMQAPKAISLQDIL